MVASQYRVVSPWHTGGFMPGNGLVRVSADIARPADTAIYASGDVISTSTVQDGGYAPVSAMNLSGDTDLTESASSLGVAFNSFKANGGIIKNLTVVLVANQATLLDLDLFLFNNLDLGTLDDNASMASTSLAAWTDYFVGRHLFPSTDRVIANASAGANGVVVYQSKDVDIEWPGFGPASGGATDANAVLNWVAVARNAYTPTNSERMLIYADVLLT